MKIKIEPGSETVIYLSGQLDTLTAIDFEKEIQGILNTDAMAVDAHLSAMESKSCKLTILGEHYWNLITKDRI